MTGNLTYLARPNHASSNPRVLHIGPLPPPWGGVATNLSYLLASDITQAFDVAVLNTSRSTLREDVSLHKQMWHAGRIRRAVDLMWQTQQAICSFRPHIVHIQSGGSDVSAIRDLLLAGIALRMKCKVVFHQHFWTDSKRFRHYRALFVPLYRQITARCHAILMSTPLHMELAADLICMDRVCCFPNTCDPRLGEVGRGRSLNLSESCLAAYIGRFSQLKGTYDLLAAASQLLEHRHVVRFEIAGQGATVDDDYRVMGLIEAQGINDTLSVLGRVSNDDKIDLFRRAHILVYPTLGESFPVTLIEGMASGLPIITTSVDYLPQLVRHGENGLIVPPGNPEELARAILDLAHDPYRRWQMGSANHEKYLKEFALEILAGKLRRIYNRILRDDSLPCIEGPNVQEACV